jgi:hypothetical protein
MIKHQKKSGIRAGQIVKIPEEWKRRKPREKVKYRG